MTWPSPRVLLAVRVLLGLTFLYASYGKILHPEPFVEAVYNYRLLPDRVIHFTVVVLPWFELLLGLFLILNLWLPGAVLSTCALFTLFVGAVAVNLARGMNIECGCFPGNGTPVSMTHVLLRDAFFLFLSVMAAFMVLRREADPKKP